MINGLLGIATAIAGITCLYLSWQKRSQSQVWLMPMGWLLNLASCVFLIRGYGGEFGVAYGLMLLPLLAWLMVLFNLEIKRKNQRATENVVFVVPATRTMLRHIALFFIVVPLSGAASAYISVALATFLPWSRVNAVVLVVMIAPLVWGLAAWWACADPTRYRATLGISIAGLIGAAIVYSQ